MNGGKETGLRGFSVRWVFLCALGLGGGLLVGLGVAAPIEALVGMMLVTPIILGIAGSMFGAVQWLAMWRNFRVGARWIVASAVGLGLGMTLGIVLVEVLGRTITGEQVRLFIISPFGRVVGLALIGTVSGLAVGAAQWFALRAFATVTGHWVLLSALGFGVGLPSGSLAAELLLGGLQSASGFVTFLGIAGLVLGGLTVRAASTIAATLRIQRAV